MWVTWLAGLLAGLTAAEGASHGAPPLSAQGNALPRVLVPQVVLPATDRQKELAADAGRGKPGPLRFAAAVAVELSPTNSGAWEPLAQGRLWRLRVVSTNATDLNFGFTQYWLPAGAMLHVIAEADDSYAGPYTAADNTAASQLWTPILPGEAAVIELFVPAGAKEEPRLVLTQVATGYRDLLHRRLDLSTPKAGSCELDVVCPQSAGWDNEIRSVGRIVIGGTGLCSGTLITDAAGDGRPFFLTANHCGINAGNAASVVVYWNYQSPACGQFGLSPTNSGTTSGSTFRAARADADFCLIELNQLPALSHAVYYAGWDRSGTTPASGVCIHHPRGDGKCISFTAGALSTTDNCIGTGGTSTGTHWQAPWFYPPTYGVTEPGSSGSGIFDGTSHQLVGDLSGGPSSCSAASGDVWDCFGKFSRAWAEGSSSADRLSDWLDPLNTGVASVSGTDPLLASVLVLTNIALVTESCSPANGAVDPGESVTVRFTLKNFGGVNTTNLVASLLATNGVLLPGAPQTYGAIASGDAAARSFTFTACGACGATIHPVLRLQDGARDLGLVTYVMGGGTTTFNLGVAGQATFWATNLDGLAAPALPSGWSSSPAGIWVTTTAQRDTQPNSLFAPNPASVADYLLTSPPIALPAANNGLSFRHYFNVESGFDGCALEISINGGAYTDIVTAGGSFVSGPYNGTVDSGYSNPLAGRSAWTGNSGGFLTTAVNLPASAAGANIRLRWRLGSDSIYGVTGWYVDTIALGQATSDCCASPLQLGSPQRVAADKIAFAYDSIAGKTYVVEASTNLNGPIWTPLQTNAGDCTRQSYTNSTTGSSRLNFRVRLQ
jgi:hypothetical protein